MMGINSEEKNNKLKKTFERYPTVANLEAYILSEILPPIADYSSAIQILYNSIDLIADQFELLTIATVISLDWPCKEFLLDTNPFLFYLNERIEKLTIDQRAIVQYLNACMCATSHGLWKEKTEEEWLEESVACDTQFFNNRISLARLIVQKGNCHKREKSMTIRVQELLRDAYYCINYSEDSVELETTTTSYINQCVLGISQNKRMMRMNSLQFFKMFD